MPHADSPRYSRRAIDALIAQRSHASHADGLVAAIAQDVDNGDVLMMAWMNADTLRETVGNWAGVLLVAQPAGVLAEGRHLRPSLRPCTTCCIDCDGDTIVMKISQSRRGLSYRREDLFLSVSERLLTGEQQPFRTDTDSYDPAC